MRSAMMWLALIGSTEALACTIAIDGPVDGEVVSDNPVFSWTGDCVGYRVGIQSFGATERWMPAGADTSFQLPEMQWAMASAGAWSDGLRWRVRGMDAVDGSITTTPGQRLFVNQRPSAPVVEVSPADPVGGVDDLVCQVVADSVDPEGDAVTVDFSWTVNGAAYGGGDTVPAADLTGGVWVCTGVASDPYGTGGADMAAVAVTRVAQPDFSLIDENATSPTAGDPVSPRDYLTKVSGWYFGHAT